MNQNFIDNNNNSLLLSDSSKSFNIDSLLIEPMNNILRKNIDSNFFKFIN